MIHAMTGQQPLTILFADVSGSTRLFETRGDVEARALIAAVLDALAGITRDHGGSVIKTIGDEIMCTFPGILSGLLAAVDMQRRLKSDPAFVRDQLGIRVGLHHGDALLEAGDVFGDAVNVAARMAALANRDQIVATAASTREITKVAGLRVRSLGAARVAGKLQPIEIVDVLWQDDTSPVTTVQSCLPSGALERMSLRLRHRDRQFELDELAAPFMLGRDPSLNLTVDADWVSRDHAHIEWSRGHFVLTDRSTNGTWVQMAGDELHLHRNSVHLRRSGVISLGVALLAGAADLLHFECD